MRSASTDTYPVCSVTLPRNSLLSPNFQKRKTCVFAPEFLPAIDISLDNFIFFTFPWMSAKSKHIPCLLPQNSKNIFGCSPTGAKFGPKSWVSDFQNFGCIRISEKFSSDSANKIFGVKKIAVRWTVSISQRNEAISPYKKLKMASAFANSSASAEFQKKWISKPYFWADGHRTLFSLIPAKSASHALQQLGATFFSIFWAKLFGFQTP